MTTLGKYQILEQLGVGSMGTVHRARDTVLDREVALKTIRAGPSVEPEIKERFYREARACARLQHPHIITIHDFGEVDDTAYISMELLVGEDLRKVLEAKRNIPVEQKIELIAQVSDALGHAHRNGVVHRDIKPSNIFVLEDNSAKVLDFGIARLGASKLTVLGRVLGTPNYMAPEQIQGNICDSRSDLFSLAIVFFELLTGIHPFQSTYIPRNIVGQPPATLRSVDNNFPSAIENLLDKALQKSPEDRFQTAEEFSGELRRVINEVGKSAGTASHNYQTANPALAAQPALLSETQAAPPSQTLTLGESGEARASEFFRLMQECDSALESKLLDKARSILKEMQRLAAVDSRFNIAVVEYERQLGALETVSRRAGNSDSDTIALPSTAPPSAVPAPAPFRPPVESSYAPSPPASLSSSASDVTRLFSRRDIPSSTTTAQESGSFHTGEVLRGSDAGNQSLLSDVYIQDKPIPSSGSSAEKTVREPQPLPERAEAARRPAPNPVKRSFPRNRVQLIALAVACCLTVLVVGIMAALHFLRTPKYQPLPAIGTAVVMSDSVPLFAGPSTAEKHLAVLRKGSKVNILRMPKFPNPEWMAVQQVGNIAGAPGYVGASALGGWSTFALMQLFDPGDFSDLPQRIEYLEALRANIAGFGNADQDNAWVEIARQNIAIARDKKASSVAPDNWQKNIGEAREALAKVSSNQSMAERSNKMQQDIADLLEPPTPAAVPPPTPPPPVIRKSDTAADYRAAEDAYRNGQYAKAIQLLKHILSVDNHNPGAKLLLEKVEKAAAEEAAAASRAGQ
jgi:serine/threonine protein kinase